jgi:signal transduction histidine kinase
MLIKNFNVEKFGEIFPHMESILHCGTYTHNIETGEQHWSKGIYDILNLEPYAIPSTAENFSSYIFEEDRARVLDSIKKSRETGVPYKIEFSVLDSKGIHKRIYAENSFIVNPHGQKSEYHGIIKDITENYFYKKALEEKVKQLDKSNQNLQEFVYIASHDLQEPLRKISTFISRLDARFRRTLGEEGDMYVKRILNAGNNMQTLLQDLLNFSRLSSTAVNFEKIALSECIESVLSDLEIKIEETKAQIICDPLPEIEGYRTQIKQLFNNLISNAIKFRKPGIAPVIRISCTVPNALDYETFSLSKDVKYIELKVEDEGIGFEQQFSEHIFMIFQRLNSKSEYSGSGIGLSICKKITENHHGFIFAKGTLNKGAVFTILLPEKQN